MQHRYLGSTFYTVFVPEGDSRPVAKILSHITGWELGEHEGNGWFQLRSDLPFTNLSEKIVGVALGRSITLADEPLLIIRKADATVVVSRTTAGIIEVDRFVLPERS